MKSAFSEVISERLKNAFLANFILSWVLVNHTIVLYVLISNDSPNIKLKYIDDLDFSWITDIFLPLFLVLIYIYIFPLVNLFLMSIRLKYIDPLLTSYKNDEQILQYDKKIEIEGKRLDLLFLEKEREIELEERRTQEQVRRTHAAEEEARFYSDKKLSEEKVLELDNKRREELEKIVKLEHVVSKERDLNKREELLNQEKERLTQEIFKYELSKHKATWCTVDKNIAIGDRATIDFVGSINGDVFEGGKAENFPLEIGSGRMIPGFEDGLLGLRCGDEKLMSVTFPEDYHAEKLKGQRVEFLVKVNKVESMMIPFDVSQ